MGLRGGGGGGGGGGRGGGSGGGVNRRVKALTLRQPWASLVVAGIKDVETRTWRTNYRGRLGIHAGSGIDREGMNEHGRLLTDYPHGAILGTVELVDCVRDNASPWAIAENYIGSSPILGPSMRQ